MRKNERPGKTNGPKVTIRSLSDYKQDDHNPNRGTDRGRRAVRQSLDEVGAARSLVSDAQGVLIAGNQTARAAAEAGITRVVEIETDGDALVVHRRRDLKTGDVRARKVAVYDNRASELGLEWDPEHLGAILAKAEVPDDILTRDERDELIGNLGSVRDEAAKIEEVSMRPPPELAWVLVGIPLERYGDAQVHVAALQKIGRVSVQSNRD